MMAETKHTEGPWTVNGQNALSPVPEVTVAWCGTPTVVTRHEGSRSVKNAEAAANAAFIVRAVNGHDDLLAALIDAREQLQGYEQERSGETYNDTRINAAIAKAST